MEGGREEGQQREHRLEMMMFRVRAKLKGRGGEGGRAEGGGIVSL